MRKLKIWILGVLFIAPMALVSQESSSKMFWVHEDHVKPSMVQEYEKTAKSLAENCAKHNIQDLNWITAQTNDFRYLYVTPINSMSDIKYDGFATLSEKMGADAMSNLFSEMNKCYTKHGDYVISLSEELSYMPNGLTQTPEGMPYRKFYYVHTTPGDEEDLAEKFKAIKDFYAEKNSKVEYRVYRSGFGAMGNFFLVAIAAEDAVAYETMGAENDAALGEDRHKVFADMMQYVTSIEEITGTMRADLGYSPKQ